MIFDKKDNFGNMIEKLFDHNRLRQRAGKAFFA